MRGDATRGRQRLQRLVGERTSGAVDRTARGLTAAGLCDGIHYASLVPSALRRTPAAGEGFDNRATDCLCDLLDDGRRERGHDEDGMAASAEGGHPRSLRIRSVSEPERRYAGVTGDLVARLVADNAGQNGSTAAWRPWVVDLCIEFRTEALAVRFERYLTSGAGHAFARRHFVE